jgi:hypothetical protein
MNNNKNNKNDKINAIFELLDKKYNGDITKYDIAEKEVEKMYLVKQRLSKLNTNIAEVKDLFSTKPTSYNKTTYVNLLSNTMFIDESPIENIYSSPILAYSYDYLSVRRIFPYSISTYLNKCREKDVMKDRSKDHQDEVYKLFDWVRSRVLDNQFTLNSVSVNKNNGVLQYNTTTKDNNFGVVTQYISAVIDPTRLINIPGTDISGKALDLSKNSALLFNYFIMFGFTEFYARCTCQDYYRKYAKKRGIANYFCSHLLYSLAQFPYYAMYYLGI